jgi:type IV pilus assembly protein PilM
MKILKDLFSFSPTSSHENGVVGVDIGSSSIKVVELQQKKDVLTLVTYGELQLGPYAGKHIGESVTLTPKQEQEALVDVIRESAVVSREAVFAMPLASSFVTNVTIEADPTADISALVRVEARKVIPASLSEVTLDWAEIASTETSSKQTKGVQPRCVLIAAIQNNALERFKVLMQFAGLKQPPTEIEAFSAIRALHTNADTEAVIIDIGATSIKLYIERGGLLMRMHRVPVGGATATTRIASVLGCSFDQAEVRKREATVASDVRRAHDSAYERAFRECKQVLQEYEAKNNSSFNTIYLAGGGALFPTVEGMLTSSLGRPVVRANPFSKVAYPAFIQDTITDIGPAFTVALGAALRTFE